MRAERLEKRAGKGGQGAKAALLGAGVICALGAGGFFFAGSGGEEPVSSTLLQVETRPAEQQMADADARPAPAEVSAPGTVTVETEPMPVERAEPVITRIEDADPAPAEPQAEPEVIVVDLSQGLPGAPAPQEETRVAAAVEIAPEDLFAPPSAPEAPEDMVVEMPSCIEMLADELDGAVFPFEIQSTALGAEYLPVLTDFADAVTACPEARIDVEGHSDSLGDGLLNLRLSWERAEAVLAEIERLGYDTAQFSAVGYGDRRPRSAGEDAASHAQNRRVEFVLR